MIEVKSCRSTKNGIMYESKNYKVKSRFIGDLLGFYVVDKNEKGRVITRFFNKINNIDNKFFNILVLLTELFIFFAIELCAVYKFPRFMFALYTVILILQLVLFIYVQLPNETKNYNSAQHRILNAYRKMHRIPNIFEANYYSRYDKKSKVNLFFVEILLYLVYILIFPKFPLFTISKIFEILKISVVFTPLQFFITKGTSVCNLYIAQYTLKTLIEVEKKKTDNNNVYYALVNGVPILKITNLFTKNKSQYIALGCCSIRDVQQAINKYYLNLHVLENTVNPEYREDFLPKEVVIDYREILVSLNETNYNEFGTIFEQKLEEVRKK